MLQDMKVFVKTYELLQWLYPTVNRFPKSQKFTLGQKIENAALGVLEGLIVSNAEIDKTASLKRTSVELEKLRVFIRLARDSKFVSLGQYEYASLMIDEIGRLLGGLCRRFIVGVPNHCPPPPVSETKKGGRDRAV